MASDALYDEIIFHDPGMVGSKRIQLLGQQPNIQRRFVCGQLAVISRRTVSVRKIIEIDVLHEELHVEYEPGDGAEIPAGNGESWSVLLRAEEVEVIKTVRVVEEVFISTRSIVTHQLEEVSLQHEELAIFDVEG